MTRTFTALFLTLLLYSSNFWGSSFVGVLAYNHERNINILVAVSQPETFSKVKRFRTARGMKLTMSRSISSKFISWLYFPLFARLLVDVISLREALRCFANWTRVSGLSNDVWWMEYIIIAWTSWSVCLKIVIMYRRVFLLTWSQRLCGLGCARHWCVAHRHKYTAWSF